MNSVLEFIRVAMNTILHSFRTAMPCWAAIVLAAIILIRSAVQKIKGEKQGGNCGMEGVILGLCFGLLIGTMLGDNIGTGISLGASAGLAVGLFIPKKTKDEDK